MLRKRNTGKRTHETKTTEGEVDSHQVTQLMQDHHRQAEMGGLLTLCLLRAARDMLQNRQQRGGPGGRVIRLLFQLSLSSREKLIDQLMYASKKMTPS